MAENVFVWGHSDRDNDNQIIISLSFSSDWGLCPIWRNLLLLDQQQKKKVLKYIKVFDFVFPFSYLRSTVL